MLKISCTLVRNNLMCCRRPGITFANVSWSGRRSVVRIMHRVEARPAELWIMYQPGAVHLRVRFQPISCTRTSVYGWEEHHDSHSSSCRLWDAFQLKICKAAGVECMEDPTEGLTVGRSRSAGMICCFSRKGTIEGQSSLPLYWAHPWSSDLLQALRKLLLRSLHLDGSAIWPEPTYAHASLSFVPTGFCIEVAALAFWSQDEEPVTTLTPDMHGAGVGRRFCQCMSSGLGTGLANSTSCVGGAAWDIQKNRKVLIVKIIHISHRPRFRFVMFEEPRRNGCTSLSWQWRLFILYIFKYKLNLYYYY